MLSLNLSWETYHLDLFFLGTFAKLQKATFSFVMSVHLSVRPSPGLSICMEQIGSHWMDFHEI
jgi:hypothetical protein